jgi:hypothetical protein
VGKVAGDREIAFGGDEEARRLPLRVLDPEHLRQRHRLVVAGVVKHAEDHRVVVVVAQRHRPRRAADLVALGLVVAEHVGAQRPLAAVGTGRLVVGDALRRHQQVVTASTSVDLPEPMSPVSRAFLPARS